MSKSQSKTEINQLFIELNVQEGEQSPPDWIKVIPAGVKLTGNDGRAFANPTAKELVDEFNKAGRRIVLDYDHATELLADKNSKVTEAPAAGWIKELKLEDGIVMGRVDWTPKGGQKVTDSEYGYVSPALNCQGAERKIKSLLSVALTNKPNFLELALNSEQEKENVMTKAIAKQLGLNPEASEEVMVAEIEKLQTNLNSAQKPSPDEYMPKADYDTVLARAEKAEGELNTVKEQGLKADAEAVIDAAIKEGKITPASKDHYLELCSSKEGLASVTKALGVAPKSVNTEPDTELENKTELNNQGLTAEQVELCAQMGISQEDYKKNL